MSARLDQLKMELITLSGSADEQLESLRKSGCVPPEQYIDELALCYDDIAAAAEGMLMDHELNGAQCERVQELNEHLESFSGSQNAHLWTADALRTADEWKKVRRIAKDCLALLSS